MKIIRFDDGAWLLQFLRLKMRQIRNLRASQMEESRDSTKQVYTSQLASPNMYIFGGFENFVVSIANDRILRILRTQNVCTYVVNDGQLQPN
uniref:Uncharacterized protein n=1 Tax=Spironucleus salmonicida TaxID=348837 RepID=V6M1I7_9EUKA|eukprot:EST47054.1 Hypothetical protein SS50377_12901 [Spironucleus salmonicida]